MATLRPLLRREGSTPMPPRQPPPDAPPTEENTAMDSLNLGQLQKLLLPVQAEMKLYGYVHEDTRPFPEEMEEWFQYTEEDATLILNSKDCFEECWSGAGIGSSWLETSSSGRDQLLDSLVNGLESPHTRSKNIRAILYVILGSWHETAGGIECDARDGSNRDYKRSETQIHEMQTVSATLCNIGAIPKLYALLRTQCDDLRNGIGDNALALSDLNALLTILYVLIEVARYDVSNGLDGRIWQALADVKPGLVQHLTALLAGLRWNDDFQLPLTRFVLLLWKVLLTKYGGQAQLDACKNVLEKDKDSLDSELKPIITTSPLDYHLFRQEITSKYPAFDPPLPLIPIEPENTSVLPPLPNRQSRSASQDSLYPQSQPPVGCAQSIFHQPVHIATPAPSPPPSPAPGGGKGQKKQNYQTNQNFPFLYSPLGETTNTLGGKGSTLLQDTLVGRHWEGSDVPASILEAGELFASRMRMSRALQQLWDVRENYIKFERGWEGFNGKQDDHEIDVKSFGLDHPDSSSFAEATDQQPQPPGSERAHQMDPPRETDDRRVQTRLDDIENLYRTSLPQLQSLVIVLLKVFLSHVTKLAAGPSSDQSNGPVNGEDDSSSEKKPNHNVNLAKEVNFQPEAGRDESSPEYGIQKLNSTRLREITSKAIAGILLSLLQWFKLSHILKFEYLSQLLLDSNYFAIALKYFQYQNLDQVLVQINDRPELDFFHFCYLHSRNASSPSPPPLDESASSSSSSDEAQPPPIPRKRPQRHSSLASSLPSTPSPPDSASPSKSLFLPLPQTPPPITSFNARIFYTAITHLRLIHKVTKRKAHRALLLVQYKSGVVLKKPFRIGQKDLHLYTLKVYKSQVPYCGRKWRQSNMNVITEIYLNCKPELRDEWLASSDLEATIGDAVPLEQAMRSLVHWWHLRVYRGEGKEAERDGKERVGEGGFFARELERMGWGGEIPGEDGEEAAVDEGEPRGTEWDGAAILGEGISGGNGGW